MIAVFDACVLVKLFLEEADSELAETVTRTADILLMPDIAAIEVAAAITRSHRNGGLSVEDANGQLQKWHQFLGFSTVRVTPFIELLPAAERLSLDLRHPLPDCLYLALAVRENVPFITADRPLAAAARATVPQLRPLSSYAD